MEKHIIYLNRIAITYKGNPLKISPLQVLKDFFNYAQPAEHVKALDEFCLAALNDQYSWRRGSPGNALFYSEQLELLMEAAYLLHRQPHVYKIRFKKQAPPCILLTMEGYSNPVYFLKTFFSHTSLKKWKVWLQAFTHAAISNCSVADEVGFWDIHVFTTRLKQLLHLAALINEALIAGNKSLFTIT